MSDAKKKLIVALDVPSRREAIDWVAMLRDHVGMFKVGTQLFTASGPDLVREIVAGGGKVFLDLKFHDIPNTVASAGIEAARLGVSIFNIHALGGREMMRRTIDSVDEICDREGLVRPSVIAVTVLTSSDSSTLAECGMNDEPNVQVLRLAMLAARSGIDGVVASPKEIRLIRSSIARQDFLIVAPGVRPAGISHDDQRRVMSPTEAAREGADYLVVGRAILNADDPIGMCDRICAEIEAVNGTAGLDV